MRKLLSCGLIAAFALVPMMIKVCAEPPPAEPVVGSSEQTPSPNCTDSCQQQASK